MGCPTVIPLTTPFTVLLRIAYHMTFSRPWVCMGCVAQVTSQSHSTGQNKGGHSSLELAANVVRGYSVCAPVRPQHHPRRP